MAFSPAQNHEIELPITLINQVPCVPARDDNMSNKQRDGTLWVLLLRLKGFQGVQRRTVAEAFAAKVTGIGKCSGKVLVKLRNGFELLRLISLNPHIDTTPNTASYL